MNHLIERELRAREKPRYRIYHTTGAIHYMPMVNGKPDNWVYIFFPASGKCYYTDVTGRVKEVPLTLERG